MIYKVRLLPEADDDLQHIYRYISKKSSGVVARNYIERIQAYLLGFERFPQRGMLRAELRVGLRSLVLNAASASPSVSKTMR